jgi:hypothetical protein
MDILKAKMLEVFENNPDKKYTLDDFYTIAHLNGCEGFDKVQLTTVILNILLELGTVDRRVVPYFAIFSLYDPSHKLLENVEDFREIPETITDLDGSIIEVNIYQIKPFYGLTPIKNTKLMN